MAVDAVVVEDLAKRFGEVSAVDGISFQIGSGELFGLLGPNGAGKTTTINLLTGLARPDRGRMYVGGVDCTDRPKAAQYLLGVVPDESNLYPELSGRENLRFCGALYGMRKRARRTRADELLSQFGLTEAADRKFSTYSKGMKRKLTIAAGIVHLPSILFLDEPTTGIDVASARQIRQLVSTLNHQGTTVLLTTHYIEEAERLCERIAFLVEGVVVRLDTVEELMRPVAGKHVLEFVVSGGPRPNIGELRASLPEARCEWAVDRLRVTASTPVRIGPIVKFLEEQGLTVVEARAVRPSLEDVFVEITGIEKEGMGGNRNHAGGTS